MNACLYHNKAGFKNWLEVFLLFTSTKQKKTLDHYTTWKVDVFEHASLWELILVLDWLANLWQIRFRDCWVTIICTVVTSQNHAKNIMALAQLANKYFLCKKIIFFILFFLRCYLSTAIDDSFSYWSYKLMDKIVYPLELFCYKLCDHSLISSWHMHVITVEKTVASSLHEVKNLT
jgi:hypothetical protein